MIIIDKDDFVSQIHNLIDKIQYEPIIIKDNKKEKFVMLDYDAYKQVIQFLNNYNLTQMEELYEQKFK